MKGGEAEHVPRFLEWRVPRPSVFRFAFGDDSFRHRRLRCMFMGVLVSYGSFVLYKNTLYSYLVACGVSLRPSGQDCLFYVCSLLPYNQCAHCLPPPPSGERRSRSVGSTLRCDKSTRTPSTVTWYFYYARLFVRCGWLQVETLSFLDVALTKHGVC